MSQENVDVLQRLYRAMKPEMLVFIRAIGRGTASGAEFDIRVAHLCQEALDAIGLRE